jgi:hypothetical protein
MIFTFGTEKEWPIPSVAYGNKKISTLAILSLLLIQFPLHFITNRTFKIKIDVPFS